MKFVVTWWVGRPGSALAQLPIKEVLEHAASHDWLDGEIHYICMGGENRAVRAVSRCVNRFGMHSHDLRSLRDEIAADFPWLQERAKGHFFDCFLRWELLRRFFGEESVVALDADIFLNGSLGNLESLLRGKTGTASSSCFVALHDSQWLETYSAELYRLEKQGARYLRQMDSGYTELREEGKLGFSGDSVFGRRLADSIEAKGSATPVFDYTPEEIFVDYLVRSGQLLQDWSLVIGGQLVCPQLLTLPNLAWLSSFPSGDRIDLGSPVSFGIRSGRYFVGGRPLLFLHFQGALYRLCTAHWIWECFPKLQPQPRPRLKSRLHPGDLDGVYADEVIAQFVSAFSSGGDDRRSRHQVEDGTVGPSPGMPVPEAAVTRRFLLNGQLTEVFHAGNLDHSDLWREDDASAVQGSEEAEK